ncbi:acetyltransferase [Metabacillus rhizolycopersici]|uniref:Acetyltransferase n=1 Tax=Metabacillus rhizolycopersici TaxID=2875709 RepID=A0ABS7UL45_9BACI|nr:acetyltransferase [Metabacillus rhizolycopersici]MBZ5749047.1 acetyltransferase [Metabacillus rhizolycopersici]
MSENIVIFGSGAHSKVVIDIIEKSNQFSILGLIDHCWPRGSVVNGYKILGDDSSVEEIHHQIHGGIVAIADNFVRSKVVAKIMSVCPDFKFVSAIHPASVIGRDVKIGDGTVVMAGAVINSNSLIADHCIINTQSSVDHDGLIENFASLAPGVTLGGNVRIGEYSAISLGANVIHSRIIGKHSVIGAGSTVVSDIDSHVVAYGIPARTIRKREIGEKYL